MRKFFLFIFFYSSMLLANELQNDSIKNFINYLEQKNQVAEKIQETYPYNKLEITIISPSDKNTKKEVFSFPSNLNPYPKEKRFYKYTKPDFIKAIYVNNRTPFLKNFSQFVERAKKNGINTLVIDIQPNMIPEQWIKKLKNENFYLIARIVIFEQGFRDYPPTKKHMEYLYRLIDLAEKAVQNGFEEIQLDYIRFADNYYSKDLTLGKRYRFIAGILRLFEDRLRPYGVRIGADIFGRIPFYENDIIGQKIEIFDRYLDHIHPMLYPSHFYGMKERINQPYQTVYDGIRNALQRVNNAEIIPYIQAFKMSVDGTGLTYKEYIKKQIQACIDANAKGFIAWNAKNDYIEFYKALREIYD